jgi:uncharacterized short protein YbdD (DUF466 family)
MEKLVIGFAGIARALRAMLGAPDYERYLEHVRAVHPGREPMTAEQFAEDRLNSRYSTPGARCC